MGIINVENLKKTYGNVVAVNDISFKIEKVKSSVFGT